METGVIVCETIRVRKLLMIVVGGAGLILNACAMNKPLTEAGALAAIEVAPKEQIDAIADEVYEWRVGNSAALLLEAGRSVTEAPLPTPAAAAAQANEARAFLARLGQLDPTTLSSDGALTQSYLVSLLQPVIDAETQYLLSFGITPYVARFGTLPYAQYASRAPLASAADRQAFIEYLEVYGDLIATIRTKTKEQAARGIRLPEPALEGARGFWVRLKDGLEGLQPDAERLSGLPEDERRAFVDDVNMVIEEKLRPEFQRLLDAIGEDYASLAPAEVGLSQYPGGDAYYRRLIEQFTGYRLEPEALHELALERMEEIESEMAALRAEVGFDGDQKAFFAKLRNDPRFLAPDPAAVEARYMSYITRIEPLIDQYFRTLPRAPYGVKRAEPAAEAGLTFGYYQAPSKADPKGYYRYNGSNLDRRSLFNAAPLIYHELIPGHHFQIALQQENENLPLVRRRAGGPDLTAYIEGWAEYAAELAQEMGLYDDPYDRYGRLAMEAFGVTRIIVDTGMNALGWSLQDARSYMAGHVFATDLEIASETLRYSTDIPGQALAYAFGSTKLLEFRQRAEEALGDNFDIQSFHDVILLAGPLPMSVLDAHLQDWERKMKSVADD